MRVGSAGLQRKREWRANQGLAGGNDDGSSLADIMVLILIDSHYGVRPFGNGSHRRRNLCDEKNTQSALLGKVVRLYITMLTGVNNIFGRCGDQ
jgi:hypothetical protein